MSDNNTNALASVSEHDQSDVSAPRRHTEFALTSHYAFKFPLFKSDSNAPKFEPHPFWTAMSSKAGHPLAKLACICRSTDANYTEEEAAAVLMNGIRPFVRPILVLLPVAFSQPIQHFAVTTLDPTQLLPRDITVAFYSLRYLVNNGGRL
ncbi:hypothetical protein B0H14DRAFT_2601569 [Mycena olivaceomarginata]|nr:hypothetical protein B0H14DRAFT_2601569 [Mycena olivaceomarginata]